MNLSAWDRGTDTSIGLNRSLFRLHRMIVRCRHPQKKGSALAAGGLFDLDQSGSGATCLGHCLHCSWSMSTTSSEPAAAEHRRSISSSGSPDSHFAWFGKVARRSSISQQAAS